MKNAAGGMNLKVVGLTVAVGAVVMLGAVQLLAKPDPPQHIARAGRPVSAVNGGTPATAAAVNGRPGNVLILTPRQAAGAPRVVAANDAAGPAGQPARLALAGDPPVRELFHPLVVPQDQTVNSGPRVPAGKAPVLPAANTPKAPAAPAAPAAAPVPAAPAPDELQMLGVVELDGQPKALLKRVSTGESRYLAKGEEAFGAKVEEIKDSEVSISRGGKTQLLAMSNAIAIESSGGSVAAAGAGPAPGFGSGFGGARNRGGGFGAPRGGGSPRGGGGAAPDSSGFSTAQIFSLPTWTERLKKLEEIKAQMEPDKYERLHTFMAERAKSEKK